MRVVVFLWVRGSFVIWTFGDMGVLKFVYRFVLIFLVCGCSVVFLFSKVIEFVYIGISEYFFWVILEGFCVIILICLLFRFF